MNTKINRGFLPFYKVGELKDWQLTGYYKNWRLALKYVPRDTLAGFRTPLINGSFTAPTAITLRKVRVIDNESSVISETVITTTITKETKGTYTYYYRNKGVISTYLDKGCIYEIYLKDSNDNEFVSDLFLAIDSTDKTYITEDNIEIITESGETMIID